MLKALRTNPVIEQFLRSFPKQQWDQCLEVTLTLGVQTALQLFPQGCSLDTLLMTVQSPSLISIALREEKQGSRQERKPARDRTPQPSPSEAKAARIQPQNGLSRYKETSRDDHVLLSPALIPEATVNPTKESDRKLLNWPLKHQSKGHSRREKAERSAPVSPTTSILAEPRTNLAALHQLNQPFAFPETPENSILRITERFLKDPFLATLSGRNSPRASRRT